MKRVYCSPDIVRVGYLNGVLAAAGIDCIVRNEWLGSASGELPPGETWPELWVLDDSLESRARQILQDHEPETATGGKWRCPECREPLEAQFELCWYCGSYRQQAETDE